MPEEQYHGDQPEMVQPPSGSSVSTISDVIRGAFQRSKAQFVGKKLRALEADGNFKYPKRKEYIQNLDCSDDMKNVFMALNSNKEMTDALREILKQCDESYAGDYEDVYKRRKVKKYEIGEQTENFINHFHNKVELKIIQFESATTDDSRNAVLTEIATLMDEMDEFSSSDILPE